MLTLFFSLCTDELIQNTDMAIALPLMDLALTTLFIILPIHERKYWKYKGIKGYFNYLKSVLC